MTEVLLDNRKNFILTILIFKQILQLKFDLIIDLQNSKRTSIYALLLRLLSKVKINGTGLYSTHR